MLSAEFISTVGSSIITSSQAAEQASEINRQDTCLCFVCDNATNGGDSIRLQYGQTTHSKTGLPIKLGQLIGDDFMVIVSVNDRLCLACIKLINLADKLEIELNTVKKVITEHLKTKYQLLDENDDRSKCSSDLKQINASTDVEGSQHSLNAKHQHKTETNDSSIVTKTDNKLPGKNELIELESDVEIVEETEDKSEAELATGTDFSFVNKQSANCNPYIIKEIIKQNNSSTQGNEMDVINFNNSKEGGLNVNRVNCSNKEIIVVGNSDDHDNSKKKNDKKFNSNRCHSLSRPMFKCSMCEDEFQTQVVLRKHIMNRHLTKWSCYFCSITFNNDSEYQSHMKMHMKNIKVQHTLGIKSSDKYDDSSENATNTLGKNNEVKTFFKCKNCKFKTRFNYLLDKHESECYLKNKSCHNNIVDLKNVHHNLKCPTCFVCFKTRKQLSLHACDSLTISKNVISNSSINNEKPFKYECGVCSITFCIKSSLITHLKSHKIENNKALLNDHYKDETEVIQVDVDLDTKNTNVIDVPDASSGINNEAEILSVHCDQCSLTFEKESSYIKHIDQVHGKNSGAIVSNVEGVDNEALNANNENAAVNEIYFGNVEHFMALTTSGVEDDPPQTLDIESDNLLKENQINLNFGTSKNAELTEENKANIISISDLINTGSNLSCDKCNITFNSKSDFDRHLVLFDHKNFHYQNFIKMDDFENHSNDNKNFECDKQIYDNKNNILEPSQMVNEIIINSLGSSKNVKNDDNCSDQITSEYGSLSCQNCTFIASTHEELEQHENADHKVLNASGMTVCSICNKYIDKNVINNHYKSNHKNIYCNYCSFETKNKKLMKQHIKEHNDKTNSRKDKQQGYLCQFCSETFKTKKSLQLHEELHPENFEYNCNKCNKNFMKERQLKRHHDEVHRDPHCYYCGKEILNLKALKSHEQRHIRELHNSKQLECDICKRVFKTRTGLRHHFAVHTGKFKYFCDFCQRGFMSRMMLEEHRSRHTKEDRYVCDVCGRKFTFQSTYWIHRKWHDNPFPYKCNFCGRLFRHTSLLAVHKRKHTGERPYKCPHCPLSFTVGGTLKRHLILHTQKFPFTCETCKRGFTTKHKYSTHLAKMHNNYELLNDKKLTQKQTDFKMVVKEKSTVGTNDENTIEKLQIDGREQSDNFEFIPDSNFTLVNMEEDDTGNPAVMMPCIMTVNNEENSGLVFEIISGSPLQPISNGISIPESAILPHMWCE